MKLAIALALVTSTGCSTRTNPEQQPETRPAQKPVQEYFSKIDPLSIDFELQVRTERRPEGVTGVIISTSPAPLPGTYHFKFCEITGGFCTAEYSFLETQFETVLDLDGEGFSASVRFCLDHPSLSMRPGVMCSHEKLASFSMPHNNRQSETFRLMSERLRIDQALRAEGNHMLGHLGTLAETVGNIDDRGGQDLPEDTRQLLDWVRDKAAGESAVGALISKEDLKKELQKMFHEVRPPEGIAQPASVTGSNSESDVERRLLALEKQLAEKNSELAELHKAFSSKASTDKQGEAKISKLEDQITVLRSAIMIQSELDGMEWAAMVVAVPILLFTFNMFNSKRARMADLVKWEYYHIFSQTMYRYKKQPIGIPLAEAWLSETWRLLTNDPESYSKYAIDQAAKADIDTSKVDMTKFVAQVSDLRQNMLVAVGVAGAVSAIYYFYNRAQINEELAKTKRIAEILKPNRMLESVKLGLKAPTSDRHPFFEFIEQNVEPRHARLRQITARLQEIAQKERDQQ